MQRGDQVWSVAAPESESIQLGGTMDSQASKLWFCSCDWHLILLPLMSNWPFWCSNPSIFPHFFLPKSPRSSPFPTFSSFPKHPIVNPVQSWNIPPPCPILCLTPLGSKPQQSETWSGIGSSWWVSCLHAGAEGLLGQPWQSLGRMSLPLSL